MVRLLIATAYHEDCISAFHTLMVQKYFQDLYEALKIFY